MNALLEFVDRIWTLSLEILGSPSLQLFLLVGSGLLAVGLLLLALTRWGHSRPVWKCVVLSVGAHIILMGYAYGTRMMTVPPAESVADSGDAADDKMELNLIDETVRNQQSDQQVREQESQSWNEFANQQPLPEFDALPRPKLDTTIEIERESASLPSIDMLPRLSPLPRADLANEADNRDSVVENKPVDSKPAEDSMTKSQAQIVQRAQLRAAEPDEKVIDEGSVVDAVPPKPIKLISTPIYEPAPPKLDNQPSDLEKALAEARQMLAIDPSQLNASPTIASPPDQAKIAEADVATSAESMFKTSQRSNVRLGDGAPLPKLYQLRRSANRLDVLRARGGSIETEQSVEAALLWLANHQEPNGRWDAGDHGGGTETKVFGHDRGGAGANADTGITGLALLAFLAGGHSHLEGPYRENVKSGLEFLVDQQSDSGSFAGDARLFARTYCHSMSLLAVSEAFAMTGDPQLRRAVEKGVAFSVAAQNRYDGGWRYQSGDEGDMSQFGWQAMALHSAELGGVAVPQTTKEKMHDFVDRCAVGAGSGLAGYRPGHGPSTTMTAESLVSRFMLGQNVSDRVIREAQFRISGELPDASNTNLYYWYYGTMAMYFSGGPEWQKWNERVKAALVSTQIPSGDNRGSWNPDGIWARYGGRVYSTAVSALILEVYYRYLPTSQQENVADSMVPIRR